MSDQINQIYDIKLVGANDLITNMATVNKSFSETKKTFQDLKATIAKGGLTGGEMATAKLELERLRIEMVKLKAAQQDGKNETIAYKTAMDAQKLAAKQAADGNKYVEGSVISLRSKLKELKDEFNRKVNVSVLSEAEITKELAGIRQIEDKLRAVSRNTNSEGTNVGEYSRGILQSFKANGLDGLIKSQIDQTKLALSSLDANFEKLKQELSSVRVTGNGSLQDIEKRLVENRTEAGKLQSSLTNVEKELKTMGGLGSQAVNGIKESFSNLKGQMAQVLVGFVGFQAAMSAIHHIVDINKEVSDSFADLQIRLHGNKQAADEVVASLRELNTRTGIKELIDTSSIVAKKGVAKEEITGITEALDRYFVVAGHEAGNRDEGVASIVKLISIFNDDKHVTKERVEEISASLIGLQNSGVATGAKMISFAERIGSIRGITGITLPNVLGLGAALEQLGQRSEVAATAGMQMLTKVFADIPKYAAFAHVSVDEFRKILKDNPFEGLVKIAEGLKGGGEDFEKAAQDFEDAGVKRAGLKAVLGDIASNAEFVRKRMKDAGVAMKDTTGVMESAATKQATFAGTIAKIGNEFDKAFTNPKLLSSLTAIADGFLWIIKAILSIPFGVVVTGLTLWGAGFAFLKGQLIETTIRQLANNAQTALGATYQAAARLGLLGKAAAERANAAAIEASNLITAQKVAALEAEIATERAVIVAIEARVAVTAEEAAANAAAIATSEAKVVALEAQIVVTEEATLATNALNTASKFSPLGVILGVLALLIPAMSAFGSGTKKSTDAIKVFNSEANLTKDIMREATEKIADQKSKAESLAATIKNLSGNTEAQKKVLNELIAIDPSFRRALDGDKISIQGLNSALVEYTGNLERAATIEAAKARQSAEFKKLGEVDNIKNELEIFKATPDKDKNLNVLSEKAQDLIKTIYIGKGNNATIDEVLEQALKTVNDAQVNQKKTTDFVTKVSTDLIKTTENAARADLLHQITLARTAMNNLRNVNKEEFEKASAEYDRLAQEYASKYNTSTNANPSSDAVSGIGERTIAIIKADLKRAKLNLSRAIVGSKEAEEYKSEVEKLKAELIAAGGAKGPRTSSSSVKTAEQLRDEKVEVQDKLFNIDKNNLQRRNLSEEQYAIELNILMQKYANAKLAIVNTAAKEETLRISEYNLDKYNSTKDTNDKLFELEKKRLEEEKETSIKVAKDFYDGVADDPESSAETKVRAKKLQDDTILDAQINFDFSMHELELKRNKISIKNALDRRDALNEIDKQIRADEKALLESQIKDIQVSAAESKSAIDLFYSQLKAANANNKNISESKRTKNADNIDKEQTSADSRFDLATLTKQLPIFKKLYDEKKITLTEYNDFLIKVKDAETKAVEDTNASLVKVTGEVKNIGDLISSKFNSILFSKKTTQDLKKNGASDSDIDYNKDLLSHAIVEGWQVAEQALHSYYDAQRQEIENDKKSAIDRLELEKTQQLNRAQSKAEEQSINKEFAAKKLAEDKKAFEKNKEIQKKQVLIQLATETAANAVSAAQNPLNGVTFGAAGAIQFAIFEALSVARAAIQVSAINRQSFATGGKIQPANIGNGLITTGSNIPPLNNGDNVLATVKTGEVILNKDQQQALGGAKTFASIGVPGFAAGGYIGDFLQPPVFRAYYENHGLQSANNTDQALEEMKGIVSNLAQQIAATDSKKVMVVSHDVTKAQKADAKKVEIGTL